MRKRSSGQTAAMEVMPNLGGAAAKARILAVDDDERNLMAIREVLDGTGEVVCAKSGEEALRFLLKQEFAVILLDILMPGIDGYETAAMIRQREQSKRTPIIFLTAINKEDGHMLRGYDVGAVDFVFKPFDPVMLRSKVSVFVELHEKTLEIQQKAAREQILLQQSLDAQSEKLEAERALRKSMERQEAILNTLAVCFHARSVEPPFTPYYVSKGAERLTGFPRQRLTSEPNFGLERVHPDDRAHLVLALQETRHLGSYACEFRWLCANGEYRVFFDQGVIFENFEGDKPAILGTMLDVTEQRALEEKLLQSQRLDAIGKLTGGLAHDFNNLLAAILSGLGLIERRANLDTATRDILDMTRRSASQGAELVTRMLAFSRRQNLKPVALRFATLRDTMMGLIAPVLGGLIRFEWQVNDSIWPARVDPGQLELALMNLVFNARDAMPSGGTITIRADNRTAASSSQDLARGDYVVIGVEDTGSGIAAEIVAKVIEPFFTTKPVGKGTGLGLSTVYGFTRQSGGTLKINSEVGRGTLMEIWLPRAIDEADTQQEAAQNASVPELYAADGLPSILLIDDSSVLRDLTAQSLQQHGFEVTVAAGGAEALAMIEREPEKFDVIVTDFAMPLVTGTDVIRFARSLRSRWPAVIITGYADASSLAERPSDVALLTKPFREQDLIDCILRAADPLSTPQAAQ